MDTHNYIEQLYMLFDREFPRPTSFHNEHCCVTDQHERPLLNTQREELDVETLAMPIDHYGSCFGTFEEVSYFVPRLLELLSISCNGFEFGTLNFSFLRLLRDNEQRYRALGLWDAIETTMHGIFADHTSTFIIQHYDEAMCKQTGWSIPYEDITESVDLIDDLLGGFFQPVLLKKQNNDGLSAWDEFIFRWAEDENPHRVAHLLDAIKRNCNDGHLGYTLPGSFIARLKDQDYRSAFVARARLSFESIESPDWLNDVLDYLESLQC